MTQTGTRAGSRAGSRAGTRAETQAGALVPAGRDTGWQVDPRFRALNWVNIVAQLSTAKGEAVIAPLGVTMSLFTILNHMRRKPDKVHTVTSIADALQSPQPGITKSVRKLLDRGWLTATPDSTDSRVKRLAMTGAGEAIHAEAAARLSDALIPAFAPLTQTEVDQMFQSLEKLRAWFDANRP